MRRTQRLLALLLALALLVPCFGAAIAEDGDEPADVAYFYEHGNAIYYRVKRQDDEGREKDGLDESAYHFYLDLMGNRQYKDYMDTDVHETLPLFDNSLAEYWASVAEYINLSAELGSISDYGPILSVLYHAATEKDAEVGVHTVANDSYKGFCTRPIYAGSMNAARDELIKQFNSKWSGRKLQNLTDAFSYPNSSLAGNAQPVVATAVHIEENENNNYSGAVVYFTDFRVVALLPDAKDKSAYVQAIDRDDAAGEPTYTYGITNETMVPVTASQSVSNSWSTTVSSEISHTEEYSFTEGISIGTSLDFGIAEMSVDVNISATQAVSDSWKEGRSQEESSSVSRSVTVALPAYTSVLLKQTNGTQTITTKYNCPIGLRFTARIVGYGKYGSDTQMKRHCWMFGTDARADLYRRAILNGDLNAEVSSEYSEAVRWSDVKKVRGYYGQEQYNPFEPEFGDIWVAARFIPFGKTGASFIQTLKSLNTDVMGVVPLEPLSVVKLEAPNVSFISDQPVSYGNFNYLHADMKVGDSSYTSLLTLSGKNSFGADYYGFNPLLGEWKVVDENGEGFEDGKAPVKLELLDKVSKSWRFTAVKPGTCFLKYFINENSYPWNAASLDEGYIENKDLSMTAALEITVTENEVKPAHTIEVTGSYTGEVDKTPEKLEDKGLGVSICGEDGKEIPESYTWEAKELPAKGINLSVDGTVSFTRAGTFHVRAKCAEHEIISDWVEITAFERKPATVTTPPKARPLTYDGEDQQLVTPGVAEGGSLVYWLDENNKETLPDGAAFTANIPEVKEAGDYTVWYKAVGDQTHSDSAPGKVSVTIRPAPVAPVQPNPDALVYNGESQALVVAGTVEGGTLKYRLSGESEWSDDIPACVNAGDYTVWYMVEGDKNHKDSAPASLKVTIEKKPLLVTANDAEKVYGDADPALNWIADGLVGSDSLIGKLERAKGENVGTYAIRQGTLSAGNNYVLYFNEGLLTIEPKAVTVKAKDATAVYGEADPALEYTADGLVGSDQLSGRLSRKEGEDVGSYPITQGTLAASGNYTLTFEDAVFTISKRAATVTAMAAGKTYGDADPELIWTASGLVGQDQATGKPVRAQGEDAGRYAIGQGSLALSGNYDVTFVGADFTISPRALTVKADDQSKTVGDADPALTYAASGLVNGDALSGSLSRDPGEAPGRYAITQGTLSASGNYDMRFEGATLTIGEKPVSVQPDFTVLAKMVTGTDNSVVISWTKVKGAQGYDVFMKKCDGVGDYPRVKTVKEQSCRISNLKKGVCYKAYVHAWKKQGKQKVYIGEPSPTVHCIPGGYNKTRTNAKSIKLNQSKLTLTEGKSFKLKASVKGQKSGRKLVNHATLVRYYSSNANVAKVNKAGKVTAVAKGSCTIYAIANNGVRTSVKVKVNAK